MGPYACAEHTSLLRLQGKAGSGRAWAGTMIVLAVNLYLMPTCRARHGGYEADHRQVPQAAQCL